MEKRNVIREKSFEFALETIDLYKKMLAEKISVDVNSNLNKADELVRILTAIVKTSQSTN